MRKKIIIGNWKMNNSLKESLDFLKATDSKLKNLAIDVGIAPPYLWLKDLRLKSKNLIISAQNCYFKNKGAFTGEVSISMLKEINIEYVIIGHSERRLMFNETDELVNLKAKALLANNLKPIICVGETLKEYQENKTLLVVTSQIKNALLDIKENEIDNIIIAYEPIWAIGTGLAATAEIAQNLCKNIRMIISELYNNEVAKKVRIQYGGSVKPNNIKRILNQKDIDGALVGGASLLPDSFLKLVNEVKINGY